MELSVVTWRWGNRYGVEYVNKISSMLRRNLHIPFRLYCITDDPSHLVSDVKPVPIWGSNGLGRARRLRIFDAEMREIFGERMLQLDIDCVITGDITPLVDRPEPLVMWRCVPETKYSVKTRQSSPNPDNGKGAYNTSIVLMNSGVIPKLWSDYCSDYKRIEREAMREGYWTAVCYPSKTKILAPGDDDQAVVSLYASRLNPPTWGESDGVYKLGRRGFKDKTRLPSNARIVFFNGSLDCHLEEVRKLDWFKEHWC